MSSLFPRSRNFLTLLAPAIALVIIATVGMVQCGAFTPPGAIADGGSGADGDVPPNALDGAQGDGSSSSSGGCRLPAAPTDACFDKSSQCKALSIPTTNIPDTNNVTPRYPHALARFKQWLYFALQEETEDGRNGSGRGFIYRVDALTMNNLVRMTPLLSWPHHLIENEGFLYYRTRTSLTSGAWELRRLDLSTTQPCTALKCGTSELITSVPGAAISGIHPVSRSSVYFKVGSDQLQYTTRNEKDSVGVWQPPQILLTGSVEGTFGYGPQLLWTELKDGTSGGKVYRLDTTGASQIAAPPVVTTQWNGPILNEYLVTDCSSNAYLYDIKNNPPFYRVDLSKVNIGSPTVFDCKDCHDGLIYALSIDEKLIYGAGPNAGRVVAIPRVGGEAVTLVSGDVWDVINDDDAVYYNDVVGGSVGRIAKK